MSQFQFVSHSTEETMRIAERLGQEAEAGDLFALDGDLGAGKTHFSKGLAKGLGVEAMVNSPTFTILKVYNGRLPFYHIDAYRLDENEEEELGLEEYMEGSGVTVVEWASNLRTQLPGRRVNITFKRVDEQERELIVCTDHVRFERIFKEFMDQ
ncbi:tRNA (adenosine(37)-N6)-threonylcarbamoyltransferase complex ATPase subunit type 1 TsaE [Salicibibacter cibarius]|uniref:tRNA threonylcarbamoyladenosine biosynthesis protein TsaE n=1 Tax=Salicibibacter cibarius TaxID=2743000 RepID=A0A7T6Z1G5_9BACI|nr:tRNA (adenosine(37)-N6)-threonylcarbamoyltransferase complex ATPase subunit type 1 TsaE [Salicibibacter cibarius]QQK75238.1 tRNA (adenosine(37)-N6)-threonylcarbamoyltransferase complex ATPase subunit type 1 TsaE [Salicibibacter cibarius]